MKNGTRPDSNAIYPIAGYDKEIYVKPTITNPNIIVGDFTYIADSEFESHVTHHDDFLYHRGYELVVSFPRATSKISLSCKGKRKRCLSRLKRSLPERSKSMISGTAGRRSVSLLSHVNSLKPIAITGFAPLLMIILGNHENCSKNHETIK